MKLKNIVMAAMTIVALGACSDSDYELDKIVPSEYNKIMYINGSGKQEITLFDTEEDYKYTFSVFKAGSKPELTAKVDIKALTQAEVDAEYSDIEGVDYKVIDSGDYSLDVSELDFSASDRYKIVTVSIKPQPIKAVLQSNPDAVYVIPLKAVSETDSINADKDELFLQINDVIMPALGFSTSDVEALQYDYGSVGDISQNIGIGLDTENKWDIDATLAIDKDWMDNYNSKNGTVYQLLQEDKYTMPSTLSLVSGITNTNITVKISGGELTPGDYMLPIRISEVSQFSISSTNNVYPLAIRIMAPELDRTNWTAEANTEELAGEGSSGKASCAIDGSLSTYWHSCWQTGTNPGMPYELIFDTKTEQTFCQIAMAQRQHNSYTDTESGKFYVSEDKVNWTEAGSFTMQKITDMQTFGLKPTKGRYLKIVINSSYRGNNASLSEVKAYGF